MVALSRVDANLLQFDASLQKLVVDFHVDENQIQNTSDSEVCKIHSVDTIDIGEGQYVCYNISQEHNIVTLYSLNSIELGKIVRVHLPQSLMNGVYSFTARSDGTNIILDSILQNGVFLSVNLPVLYILDQKVAFPDSDWFCFMNPYDFSVRMPRLLYNISNDFSVVFLKDGGLLGLKRQGEWQQEPILFNDNSYIQSLTRIFTRKSKSRNSNRVVACRVFQERFLLVLTQSCHLRIWDLASLILIKDYDLLQDEQLAHNFQGLHGISLKYITIHENLLFMYLPIGNGSFYCGKLFLDNAGELDFTLLQKVDAKLTSSTIWSLVDMKLASPSNGTHPDSLKLVALWKSASISKVQILDIHKEGGLKVFGWIETMNKSLQDIESSLLYVTSTEDFNRAMLSLESNYPVLLVDRAKAILKQNNIALPQEGSLSSLEEYFLNYKTLLKDLKANCDEPGSLTIYKDGLLVINCLHSFNHAIYKANSALESIYYNSDLEEQDKLSVFLTSIGGFASTLSKETLNYVKQDLIDIVCENHSQDGEIDAKISNIFTTRIQNNFEASNLHILFNELSSLNLLELLNKFINTYLTTNVATNMILDTLIGDRFSKVIIANSLYSTIKIQNTFVFRVLLTFSILDFDYSAFKSQVKVLLDIFYKQSLFLELFRQNHSMAIEKVLQISTHYGNGIRIDLYANWDKYLQHAVSVINKASIGNNVFYMDFFTEYVVKNNMNANKGNQVEQFCYNIAQRYYIHNEDSEKFKLGMAFFVCRKYKEAYNFLHIDGWEILNDTAGLSAVMENKSNTIWEDLLDSFQAPNKVSSFYYQLSLLFSRNGSTEFALKSVKKSIENSMLQLDVQESKDFQESQLKQYLDLLIYYHMFEEALEVLRLSDTKLSYDIRYAYFQTLLQTTTGNRTFFSILLEACHKFEKLYLSTEDFEIVDALLRVQISAEEAKGDYENIWVQYKKLYSFRMVSGQERSAAEAIYRYAKLYGQKNLQAMKKSFLIISNILSVFANQNDRWLLDGASIVSIDDIQGELNRLM